MATAGPRPTIRWRTVCVDHPSGPCVPYVKMNDGASALAAFERMGECLAPETDRLPSSPWVSCIAGRGVALSLLSRHNEAMDAFEEVLHTDPGFFERWSEVAPHYELSLRVTDRAKEGSAS
jgi:hypothetical protein